MYCLFLFRYPVCMYVYMYVCTYKLQLAGPSIRQAPSGASIHPYTLCIARHGSEPRCICVHPRHPFQRWLFPLPVHKLKKRGGFKRWVSFGGVSVLGCEARFFNPQKGEANERSSRGFRKITKTHRSSVPSLALHPSSPHTHNRASRQHNTTAPHRIANRKSQTKILDIETSTTTTTARGVRVIHDLELRPDELHGIVDFTALKQLQTRTIEHDLGLRAPLPLPVRVRYERKHGVVLAQRRRLLCGSRTRCCGGRYFGCDVGCGGWWWWWWCRRSGGGGRGYGR